MSQHVETMRAALHEIGQRDLAAGVVDPKKPGALYTSAHLRRPETRNLIEKASVIAHISVNGPTAEVRCSTHCVTWFHQDSQPLEWDQCAKVAAWQMLHDPTTVCANTPRPI